MTFSVETVNQLVQHYFTALDGHTPIQPIAALAPALTMAEGYQVQAAIVAELQQRGLTIAGKKAAAVSATAQAKMKISEPIYGHLFDAYRVDNGATLAAGRLIQPYLECELAFVLGRPLAGPQATVADVLAATEVVVAAYDIIDFRTEGWQPGLAEALCTNVYAVHFMLGDQPGNPTRLDLAQLNITLHKNGAPVTTASAGTIMGHPARSIAWMANKLAEHGRRFEAGEVALTGAITSPHPLALGDQFEAVFEGLGRLVVKFE